MRNKEWQDYSLILKELLGLDNSPVALACLKEPLLKTSDKKLRICKAILDAAKGEILQVNKSNNICFGASWHLGFHKIKHQKMQDMFNKFVVEEEKLFGSYQALGNLISQLEAPPDNSDSYFILSPMEKADFIPQLVIFVVNAESASRILTLATFLDGIMPKIKIGGPTCRMAIIYPLISAELNISFYDCTARKLCNVDKDKLLITIPYEKIPKIVENIDKCSGGRAKVELPQELRNLQ